MKVAIFGIALLSAAGLAGWWLGKKQALLPRAPLPQPAARAEPSRGFSVQRGDHSVKWSESMRETDPDTRFRLLAGLVKTWSAEAPEEAWAALLQDTEALGGELEPRLPGLAGTIFFHWAAIRGWETALQAAASAPRFYQEQIGRVLGDLHGQMPGVPRDLKELVPLLTDSPSGVRTGLVSQALFKSRSPGLPAKADWETWLAHLRQYGWTGEERETMTKSISNQAMAEDPKATAEWLVSLPGAPDQQGGRILDIVRQWGRSAPNACGEWLNTRTLGPESDSALADFAYTAARDDPESAVAWAQRIQDPERREAHTRNQLRHWQMLAPTEAAAAAERLGLKMEGF